MSIATIKDKPDNNYPVICLMGPTAVGKTDLAIDLATKVFDIQFDIISVDSAMVYHGLNIGTGKPEASILLEVPHALVDIRQPYDSYSVANFCHDVDGLIKKSIKNNKIPLLVGGTMMYFNALQKGLAKLPKANPEIRQKLTQDLNLLGLHKLYADLQKVDPISAARINANDTQRIIRALEVYYNAGESLSNLLAQNSQQSNALVDTDNYNFINIILAPEDRAYLHKRIEQRFYSMLDLGFINEVQLLFNNPKVTADLPAIRSCGYRQIWQYLNGELSKPEMVDKSIISTRQLAKRQLTWLRQWPDTRDASNTNNTKWFNSQDLECFNKIIHYLLSFDFPNLVV